MTDAKKILVVGAGMDQVDPIRLAKEMGFTVYTVDIDAEAPGFQYADFHATISTTDFDSVVNYITEHEIDGIVTVASETSIPTIAKVCDKLGLPGINSDTALAATNKNVMRDRVSKAGVKCPASVEISELQMAFDFIEKTKGPWVIKPSDTSGQRGIFLIHEKADLTKYFGEAVSFSRDQKAILEQFIPGPEINVCAMVNDGKVDFLSLSDRITDPNKNFGIAVKHLVPGKLTEQQATAIKDSCSRAINAIGLKNGIAYPQLINSPDGPHFIEIAARMPGGHNREIAMFTSGVDMVKVAIRQAMGEKVTLENSITEPRYGSTFVRFITRNDIPTDKQYITDYEGLKEVAKHPGVKKVFLHLRPGDKIPPLANSTARFGGVITVGSDRTESVALAEEMVKKIKIH